MTKRTWWTRLTRAVTRWIEELAGDGWEDYAPEVPRTLTEFTTRTPRSES